MTAYVQKIRVPVRVSQGGMPPIEGYLSCGPQAQFHAGPETLLERLNEPSRVIPFQRADDERTILLNRADIDWIAADAAVSPSLVCPPTYQVTHQESVDLRLLGGASLEGQVQIELPEHLNRVSQGGMPPIEGYLSCGPQAQFHAGPETLLERLNEPSRVIPFQRAEDERTILLNRADIDWIAADAAVSPSLVCPPTYQVTHQESVDLRLLGGASLEGQVQIELPEHLNRVSDFLNAPEDFFPLLTPFGVLLVNKQRVSSYELHSASPGPPFGKDVEAARHGGAA